MDGRIISLEAEVDIFNNPRSNDARYPGSLFRISMPLLPGAERPSA